MTAFYVDTSALIKRYVDELGSNWLRSTLSMRPPPAIIVVHLVTAEVTSAFMRRVREGTLTPAEYAQAQNAFRADCLTDYDLVTVTAPILDEADLLLERHSLRAYDAIHLATALTTNRELLANDMESLTLLSADSRLNAAATAEGLMADNPADHL